MKDDYDATRLDSLERNLWVLLKKKGNKQYWIISLQEQNRDSAEKEVVLKHKSQHQNLEISRRQLLQWQCIFKCFMNQHNESKGKLNDASVQ